MNIYFHVKYVHMLIWPLHPFPTPNKAKIQARQIILCENISSVPTPEVQAATTVPHRGSAIVIKEERSERGREGIGAFFAHERLLVRL